jgi:hypothetical protein
MPKLILDQDYRFADDAADLEKAKMGVPQGITNPPLADLAQSEVHEWQVATDRSLIDGSILFEASADGRIAAYAGRWGVRCAEDPSCVALASGSRPIDRWSSTPCLLRCSRHEGFSRGEVALMGFCSGWVKAPQIHFCNG